MYKINVLPQEMPIKAENVPLTSAEIEINLSNKTVAVTESKYTELRYKLTYTVQDMVGKPKYFLAFALARFRTVRQIYLLLSKLLPQSNATTDYGTDSLFTELDTTKATNILKQDGIFLGASIPQNFLNDLLLYLSNQDCYAGGREDLGFQISEKNKLDRIFKQPFYVARYFNISSDCPQIIQLANDPKLREIAANYIGKQAKYTGASLFWTFPIEGTSCDADQQQFRYFHYDIDDFAGLRFCFYLTDVTLEDGPHISIRGSHLKKSILHVLNYVSRIQTKEELTRFYDSEQFLTIVGNAGLGFIEDTFCFHKGNPPRNKPRLLLQLHFAAHNYNQEAYLDYRDPKSLNSFQQTPSSTDNLHLENFLLVCGQQNVPASGESI
ncbi:MAG: hypothetical protein WBM44_20040 [Waterburya sp.]